MQAFTIKTNKSDYPFLAIADGFKSAVEVLYQKGIYDTDIISVQQLESVKSDHILIEERLTDREVLREEVRRELQETMPKWMPEPAGAAGGADRDIYLIRTERGITSRHRASAATTTTLCLTHWSNCQDCQSKTNSRRKAQY